MDLLPQSDIHLVLAFDTTLLDISSNELLEFNVSIYTLVPEVFFRREENIKRQTN